MRIKAKLHDGREVIGEFQKVTKFGKFALAVSRGTQRFNIWNGGEQTLPNGETVLKRSREIIFPSAIATLTEIDAEGRPVEHVQSGRYGTFTAPEPRPENLPAAVLSGVEYPVHRDPDNFRNFIWTTFPSDGVSGDKYFLDGHGDSGAPASSWASDEDDRSSLDDNEDEDDDIY